MNELSVRAAGQVRYRPSTATSGHDWVDAAPFRAYLQFLAAIGDVPPEVVALLAGIAPRLSRRLLTGDGNRPLRRISPDTARRLYAITPSVLHECRYRTVPAGPVVATMRAMAELGWSAAVWSERLGLSPAAVTSLFTGRAQTCSFWLSLQVRAAAVDLRSDPSWVGTRLRHSIPAGSSGPSTDRRAA